MARDPCRPPPDDTNERYRQAYAEWQQAFDYYLRLAREEASAAKLRAAAAAVHAAALNKGRVAGFAEDEDC